MISKMKKVISVALAAVLSMSLCTQAGALEYSGTASYMSGKYYRKLQQVSLTGDPRTDIVAVARSQVGYQEGGSPNQLSGEVFGSVNHTEYGAWYGTQDLWCAMFVSWCANVAGISTDTVPSHCYTPDGLSWFAARGLAYTRAEVQSRKYTPKPGDLIYFKSSRNAKTTNHVGIVTGYVNGRIYTLEGNSSSAGKATSGGMVTEHSYPMTNTYIVFICAPNYASDSTNVLPDAHEREEKLQMESLRNALFCLEAGDELRYDAVHTDPVGGVSIGCGQWGGAEAGALLRQIYEADQDAFATLDPEGLLPREGLLSSVNEKQCRVLKAVLASEAGVQVQNDRMDRSIRNWMGRAEALGVADRDALLLCCALYQLRGSIAAERIIGKAGTAPNGEALLNVIKDTDPGLYRTCCLLVN